jgi:hypothetical protein
MKKNDLYFASRYDEFCYPLSYFQEHLEYGGEYEGEEMKLYKAVRSDVPGFFWCCFYDTVFEKDEDTCGKPCKGYAPRNGKSGCCKHYSLKLYECSDEFIILKK